ncbi:DivIVA domain-containing protein [Tannockella kyphosi]|uniref:DivIVA domain-containing protein n=1 Tax=Tannockella kyphosi TaxID=2899121 RepID=UPI00201152D6|nr:DivIVA domain-containing protein [Tannockella kyphosi]
MEKNIQLSPKKIVSKEFKIDFKGYNAMEVDFFLDTVVKDYELFAAMLNESYDKIDSLEEQLIANKAVIADLQKEKLVQEDNIQALEENISSNVDILKRLSALEKAVYNQNR